MGTLIHVISGELTGNANLLKAYIHRSVLNVVDDDKAIDPLPQEQDTDGDGQLTFTLIDTFDDLEQPSAPEYNRPEAAEKNDQSVDDVLDSGWCCICCIHHGL